MIPILYKLHKYLSIIVGIQVLLWMLSGLYMTAVPLTMVHGDHLRKISTPEPLTNSDSWTPISDIMARLDAGQISSIKTFQRLGRPTYLLQTDNKPVLIDAITGQPVADLASDEATEIASEAYQGSGKALDARLITSYTDAPEIKGRPLPIWQVNFDDWLSTSLYVSNIEASVTTARSSIWRVFDFVWMLHIMDYDERKDFNNPLVIFMASAGLLIVLTGAIMLINGLSKRGVKYLK